VIYGSSPPVTIPLLLPQPWGFDIVLLFGDQFSNPGYKKGDNSPTQGLLSTSTISVCAIKRVATLIAVQ